MEAGTAAVEALMAVGEAAFTVAEAASMATEDFKVVAASAAEAASTAGLPEACITGAPECVQAAHTAAALLGCTEEVRARTVAAHMALLTSAAAAQAPA